MEMKGNKNMYLYALIILCICMSGLEVILNLQNKVVSDSTQSIWGAVALILSILWAYYDADRKDFEKPFDFGFLVYLFWPIAFPWYLITTRGTEGILMYLGFVLLWAGPWFSGLVVYVYFT